MDWGDKEHAFCLSTPDGGMEKGKLTHTPESLHAWFKKLGERLGGQPVALALEANRGALLNVLAQYAWLRIYPVNPMTSARYRRAFTVSGAKDDQPDAVVLQEILRLHPHKLTLWEQADEQTRELDLLVRARRDAVDRRTQCTNQLTLLLKSYFPQALELTGGDLTASMAVEFLGRWGDLITLKAARPSTVESFYYKHNVRRPEKVQGRLELVKRSVALTTDPIVVSTSKLQLELLLAQIRMFNKHIAKLDKQISSSFKKHPEAALFNNLPGAGPALAPRLLVAFGEDRGRYPAANNLQKYVGIAPVREKSGNQLWTHWRWQAPSFIRQSFIEWAGQTVVWCEWAKHYYQRMKRRGKGHHVILRALAFKWIRVLWKCWQTRVPYDESRYIKAMKRRNSPNVPLPIAA